MLGRLLHSEACWRSFRGLRAVLSLRPISVRGPGRRSVAVSVAKLDQTRLQPWASSPRPTRGASRPGSGRVHRSRGSASARRPRPGSSWLQNRSGKCSERVSEWSFRRGPRDLAPTSSHHQSFNDSTPSGAQVIELPQKDIPASSPSSPWPPLVGPKTTKRDRRTPSALAAHRRASRPHTPQSPRQATVPRGDPIPATTIPGKFPAASS